MKHLINPDFLYLESFLQNIADNFGTVGKHFGDGTRNKIRLVEKDGLVINTKSFKIPNLINKIVYRYFRKSKAKRSFEYANYLIKNNIGTPKPIAYFENYSALGLRDSYYMSEHLVTPLTFRELVTKPDYPDHDTILRQFTRFSFNLHEKGIEFVDHSPGNTLIQKDSEGQYSFYLVDLNRMNFHDTMSFELRMKNLSRLTPKKEMIQVMSNEYAKVSGLPEDKVFAALWEETSQFQYRYFRKKRIKKKLYFWK